MGSIRFTSRSCFEPKMVVRTLLIIQVFRCPEAGEAYQNGSEPARNPGAPVIPSVARDLGGRWLEDHALRHRTPRSLATLGMTRAQRSRSEERRVGKAARG